MTGVDPSAQLGEDVQLGKNTLVEPDVVIGDGCVIGHNVILYKGTKIGSGVRIDDNVVIGKQPMRAAFSTLKLEDVLPPAEIGDECIIGTSVVIYAGCRLGSRILVADLATIRENVKVGDSTIVGRGVAIENLCEVGSKVKLETGCYITARSVIEDLCFVAPMVTTSNDNFLGRTEERFKHTKGPHLKRGARVGANAVLLPGVVIGEDAVVGAGAVAVKDVPPYKVFVGVPAEELRDTPVEQRLPEDED
jgi:acetyltransferase-like isoleucine patch superfamily enzyme